MKSIGGNHSLGTGAQAASHALRAAQKRFESASADIARSSLERNPPAAQEQQAAPAPNPTRGTSSPVGAPPTPGPPGGASPADLTEAMVRQDQAGYEIEANVKTLQAFDDMLQEVTRLVRK